MGVGNFSYWPLSPIGQSESLSLPYVQYTPWLNTNIQLLIDEKRKKNPTRQKIRDV
jgi:hypothetical protein